MRLLRQTCGLLLLAAAAAAAAPAPVLHHAALVRLDPSSHLLTVTDTLTVPAGVDSVTLNRSLALMAIEREGPGGTTAERFRCRPGATPTRPDSTMRTIPVRGAARLVLHYAGCWFQSTDAVVFSRENVGGEIEGTVGEEGVYLAAGAGWLPLADGALATHRVTVVSPAGWEPVTQGRRVRHEAAGDSLVTVWDAVHPSDGLTLIANRYHVTERTFGDVTAYTFFLADEPDLVETYLERTGAYLEMYGRMIGPYPYAKFATVENWFPTGYGFPSWTLLGSQILHLPFIPATSFGHEICHNWWGNSAFVGEGGNWCEGLTVYCADYHYKELESADAAREYRRNLLKDYAAYVRDGRDFPLTAFTARHSGASRAIGYGKAMMVFHMVDRLIGREAFLAALRDVWSGHLFQPVTWDDFFAAFAVRGGVDLAAFRDQWLTRTGAPRLDLLDAERRGDRVVVTIGQDEPVYDLQVPVVVTTADGEEEFTVHLDGPRGTFTLRAPGATAVAVDPDDHLFRRLHPEEIEPTISQVLGDPQPRFVLPGGNAAAREFAARWIEQGEPIVVPADAPADGHARLLVAPDPAVAARFLPDGVTLAGSLLFLEGRRIDLRSGSVVLAVADPEAPATTDLVVLCRETSALPSLADRVSHYGKYSWLVFPPRGRPQKGNWPVTGSPLTADLTRGENR